MNRRYSTIVRYVFGILTLSTRTYYYNNVPTTSETRRCEHTRILIRDAYKHALISSYKERVFKFILLLNLRKKNSYEF